MNEEHNMTLREKWSKWIYRRVLDTTNADDEVVFNWFLAQFDTMLAEDIEKIEHSPDDSTVYAKSILEARRLSIKK